MKKRAAGLMTAALLAAALLGGCGASKGGSASSTAMAQEAPADMMMENAAGAMESGADYGGVQSSLTPQPDSSRKIVYTASMRMESTDFEAARTALLAAVEEHGGYLEFTDQSGSAKQGNRRVYYTVRVPAEHYTAFLERAGEAGSVLNLNESAQDITLDYVDVQARLESLQNQKRRLEVLADKADTTADLLEIENQLSQVQYQLESYTRQMKAMDNQVDYCTVDISLSEVVTLTPRGVTFGERVSDAFTGGWNAFAAFVQDAVIALIYVLPGLVVLGAVLAAVAALVRRRRAKRKQTSAKKPPCTAAARSSQRIN